jgi:hypothetical protein
MKRLLGAIVDGVGLSAGRDLYQKAKEAIAAPDAEVADPEAAARAEKERAAEERRAEKARVKAEKLRVAETAAREKKIEQELAALKRKLGKP